MRLQVLSGKVGHWGTARTISARSRFQTSSEESRAEKEPHQPCFLHARLSLPLRESGRSDAPRRTTLANVMTVGTWRYEGSGS